jgi:hypothetical protein
VQSSWSNPLYSETPVSDVTYIREVLSDLGSSIELRKQQTVSATQVVMHYELATSSPSRSHGLQEAEGVYAVPCAAVIWNVAGDFAEEVFPFTAGIVPSLGRIVRWTS